MQQLQTVRKTSSNTEIMSAQKCWDPCVLLSQRQKLMISQRRMEKESSSYCLCDKLHSALLPCYLMAPSLFGEQIKQGSQRHLHITICVWIYSSLWTMPREKTFLFPFFDWRVHPKKHLGHHHRGRDIEKTRCQELCARSAWSFVISPWKRALKREAIDLNVLHYANWKSRTSSPSSRWWSWRPPQVAA